MAACSSAGLDSFVFSHSYGYRYFVYLEEEERHRYLTKEISEVCCIIIKECFLKEIWMNI